MIAYDDTAGRAATASVTGDLVGQTLTTGVHKSTGPLAVSGTVTLDGQGDPDAVFIFQIASTLKTATASHINVINNAQACHVFWQVGSSATLGTASSFQGTILALTSITVNTNTAVKGRALAHNGQVTLDDNTVTTPTCDPAPPALVPPAVIPPAVIPPAAVLPPVVTVPVTTGHGAVATSLSRPIPPSAGGEALLPRTGFATLPISVGGGALLALGIMLQRAGRRRHKHERPFRLGAPRWVLGLAG